jgi:hypothetical protein
VNGRDSHLPYLDSGGAKQNGNFPEIEVRTLFSFHIFLSQQGKGFSFHSYVQIGSWAHPVSYLKDTGGFFSMVKQSKYEADQSYAPSAEISWRMCGTITALPYTSLCHGY